LFAVPGKRAARADLCAGTGHQPDQLWLLLTSQPADAGTCFDFGLQLIVQTAHIHSLSVMDEQKIERAPTILLLVLLLLRFYGLACMVLQQNVLLRL
jgi:hypothetical protein